MDGKVCLISGAWKNKLWSLEFILQLMRSQESFLSRDNGRINLAVLVYKNLLESHRVGVCLIELHLRRSELFQPALPR